MLFVDDDSHVLGAHPESLARVPLNQAHVVLRGVGVVIFSAILRFQPTHFLPAENSSFSFHPQNLC